MKKVEVYYYGLGTFEVDENKAVAFKKELEESVRFINDVNLRGFWSGSSNVDREIRDACKEVCEKHGATRKD